MDNLEEIPSTYVENYNTVFEPIPRPRTSHLHAQGGRSSRVGWAENNSDIVPPDPDSNSLMSPTLMKVPSPTPSRGPSFDNLLNNSGEGTFSPDESSLSSKSSRRRGSEMSKQTRQRIRQQAKSVVEKKRGSVQLAKRLLRSQLQSSFGVIDRPKDYSVVDERIVNSIELGSKYAVEDHSVVPPTNIQQIFFFGKDTTSDFNEEMAPSLTTVQRNSEELNSLLQDVFYSKPTNTSKAMRENFGSYLTQYRSRDLAQLGMCSRIEDPFALLDSHFFAARPPRDYSVLVQRLGNVFLNNTSGLRGVENVVTNRPLRIDKEEDEDFELVDYKKANDFQETDDWKRSTSKFSHLKIDLNRLEFIHHWLFSQENALAREVQNLYNAYETTIEKAIELIRKYLEIKQNELLRSLSEADKLGVQSELSQICQEISSLKEEMVKISELVDGAWQRLELYRSNNGKQSTDIVLHKVEQCDANLEKQYKLEDLPAEFQEILNCSTYVLKTVAHVNIAPDKLEVDRLAAIKKCRVQVQIHFNNILVCTTDEATLNAQTFCANFCKFFDLEVFERPELLSLTVRERFGRGVWQVVAKIFIPIPDDQPPTTMEENQSDENTLLNAMEFASEIKRGSYKGSLGCGILHISPYMHGKLYCKARWLKRGIDLPKKIIDTTCVTDSTSILNIIPHETELVTEEELNANPRLQALQQRFQQRYKNIDSRIASLEENYPNLATGSGGMELSLDVHRRIGHSYATLLRMRHLTDNLELTQKIKSYSEVVHEESLPTMFRAFGSIFGPPDLSRKLKPMRKTKDARIQQSLGGYTYRLLVNIQSASNLPERVSGDRTHVFVEANFRKQTVRTTVVEGNKQANWQETVHLDIFDSPTSTPNFNAIVDCLQFNLFDQLITPLSYDNREPNTFHKQVECRWIGTVSIPFSTIYSLTKIDGLLTVTAPLFCSGYRMTDRHASMKLLITIDPPQPPPRISAAANYVFDEVDWKVVADCEKWERKLRLLFPERRYSCMANGSNGKRILACRFLRKISPPPKLVELANQNIRGAVLMAANLIRCIPFLTDQNLPENNRSVIFPGVADLWTTADEMLTIGCGDEEEHALLLVCWLMSLEVSSALILGTSLPEGLKGVYVLAQFDDLNAWLINPCNEMVYSPDDPTCPLISVGTVVTANNIYGNIQKANHPSMLDFDLRKKSHWEPLFTVNQSDLVSVQTNAIRYSSVSEDLLMELRANLEREIKFHFDEARNYGIPQWNLLACRALRDILSDLSDSWQLDEGHHRHQMRDIELKLGQLKHSYRITAVGFARPYISKKQLVAEVLKMNIHVNSAHSVQFALAVHIQPYVNQIVCCSVAIATLIPLAV